MRYEKRTNELFESLVRIEDNGVEWFIPINETNSDYQRYLKWLENPEAEETPHTL